MLNDRVVFVTGGAQGIGLGVSRAVLEQGARLAIADINETLVTETRESLLAEFNLAGEQVFACAVNVCEEDSVLAAMAVTRSHFGVLNGLVNNAGVIRLGEDIGASVEDWRLQMDVNVVGTHLCCKAFAEQLIASKQAGAIVNIASNAGKVGYPNMAGYNASKAAVINLTRTLAAEWSQYHINVNAVCPGGVDTPMLKQVAEVIARRIGEDADKLLKTMVPAQLGRHIQPLEIGRVVAFLLSAEAEIIRGQSINADGGDTPC